MAVRTYQLYLATTITQPVLGAVVPVDLTSRNNATWQINFKSLFGNDYGKYKRCSVRFRFFSQDLTSADTENIDNAMAGYIIANFTTVASMSIGQGVPLGFLSGSNIIYTPGGLPLVYYDNSSMSDNQGVDITMPSENQFLNIQCRSLTNGALLVPAGGNSFPHYQIMLQFELSDPIV